MLATDNSIPEIEDPIDAPSTPDEPPADSGDGGDDGDDSARWLTVATFWLAPQAHLARIQLENHDIDCVIIDEYLVATDWFLANAVGGIKLQVREADLYRAHELLTSESQRRIEQADSEPLSDGEPRCPQCGSDQIEVQRFSRKVAFWSILFLGLPIPFIHRARRCIACGFEWK